MKHCPSNSELDGFLARNEEQPGDDAIAEHVEQCRQCSRYVTSRFTTLLSPEADPEATPRTVMEPLLRYTRDQLPPEVSAQLLEKLRFIPKAYQEPKPDSGSQDGAPPKKIGEYEIIRLLGRGGMGRVYLVQRAEQPEQFALKLLSADFASSNEAVRRAKKEIAALGRLQHPNIVKAIDHGELNGRPYLVTEFLDGQNLEALVYANGPMNVQRACEITIAAAKGLQHAHECGIIHRDIKPSNLLLTNSGELKLLDFGVAHYSVTSDSTSQQTPSGYLLGTAHYMSPEQMESVRQADARSGVYSLACVLTFLLTGQTVFQVGRYYEILVAHRFTAAPSLKVKLPSIPDDLNTLVLSSLEKLPEKRPQSMREVIDALTPFTTEEYAAAPVVQNSDLASSPNSTQPESPKPVVEPMTTFEIVLGIVLFCAVAIFTLWLLVQGL